MITELKEAMEAHIQNNLECGCQLVIYKNGELICDLAAGHLDASRKRKVDARTLFPVFSAGKSVLTTLAHICVEKGFLSYGDPVVKYWSEYRNGKEDTCFWHILTHRAAMWKLPDTFSIRECYDYEKCCAALEKAPLCGTLGGFHEYHAYTYGILLARLLEKATGRSLRNLLREFILDPLEIEDFYWGNPGMRPENRARIVPEKGKEDIAGNEFLAVNEDEVLFDGLNPSVNTAATAGSLAKIHAALVGKGYKNIRLLQDKTIENAIEIRRHSDYPVKAEEWDKFGLGYIVSGDAPPWNRFFGQAGACGAEGFADRVTGYAVGLTRNQQLPSDPDYPLRNAVSQILGIPCRVW